MDSIYSFWSRPDLSLVWKNVFWNAWDNKIVHMAAFYIISQATLSQIFKNRKLYDDHKNKWKIFMSIYNYSMALYSFITFWCCLYGLYRAGLFSDDCDKIYSEVYFSVTAKIFFLSKYVEYLDTYFLIIAGKQVSWLQYFHHIGAPIDSWLLFAFKNEGLWIFLQFNSLIHSIMYLYYGFSALDIRMPLKWMLTLLQLIQLALGNFLSAKYLNISCYANDPYRMATWSINMFYVGTLIFLFIHFFFTSYLQPGETKKKKEGTTMTGNNTKKSVSSPKAKSDTNNIATNVKKNKNN